MNLPIRNIAIIAHVDHGKTTLVDALFRQAGLFRENQAVHERVMDRNDLEKEKGITILSKVASIHYNHIKINIVDTPGHADFGGEVERILSMVDGVLLVVDACEGPMPQTRFVLKKAFEHKLKPIVCINKIDREGARPMEAYDKTLDLFIELGADEDDLFFPHLFCSGASGFARISPEGPEQNMKPLLDMIANSVPAPNVNPEGPTRLQVTNLDYSDFLGRMFGGKVLRGSVNIGDRLTHIRGEQQSGFNATKLWVYEGLQLKEVSEVKAGEIAMMSGFEDVLVGDSICSPAHIDPLPEIQVEPPTLSMNFYANNTPLAGKDGGKFLTIHKIRDRLERETRTDVCFKIDPDAPADTVKIFARGELQLAILIENMRREGYEMTLSRPQVIMKKNEEGALCEPYEMLTLDLPEDSMGDVMEELSRRQGELNNMSGGQTGRTVLQYRVPTRGIIGLRSIYLTLTRGLGIMASLFEGYHPCASSIEHRKKGALIAKDPGKITRYAYEDVQQRGTLFYPVGFDTYAGMIVGECSRDEDMIVNITKTKAATNIRSSTQEATTGLDPHKEFSLELALSWLKDDELLEVTPKYLRFCKKILDHSERRVIERRATR